MSTTLKYTKDEEIYIIMFHIMRKCKSTFKHFTAFSCRIEKWKDLLRRFYSKFLKNKHYSSWGGGGGGWGCDNIQLILIFT